MKKKAILLLAVGLLLMAPSAGSIVSQAGTWQTAGDKWQYQKDDGTFVISGWCQDTDNGKWYHFDDQGHMQTGWISVEGKSYYLDSNGVMLVNTVTPDGYLVGADGAWLSDDSSALPTQQAGWRQDDVGWWYQTASGYFTDKWKNFDGKRYYFGADGYMATGFQTIEGNDYYFNNDGALVKKDFTLDGVRYSVDSQGVITEQTDLDYDSDDSYADYSYDRDSDDIYDSPDLWGNNDNQIGDGHDDTYAMEVIDIVNEERRKRGYSELTVNDSLMAAASIRAEELIEKYAHTRPDGTSCFTSVKDMGVTYSSVGENIAYGQSSPEAVMTSWMNSSGHKKNILKSGFEEIGVGCYVNNGVCYWVQLFVGN